MNGYYGREKRNSTLDVEFLCRRDFLKPSEARVIGRHQRGAEARYALDHREEGANTAHEKEHLGSFFVFRFGLSLSVAALPGPDRLGWAGSLVL